MRDRLGVWDHVFNNQIKKDLTGQAKMNIFQKSRKGVLKSIKFCLFSEKPFKRNAEISVSVIF